MGNENSKVPEIKPFTISEKAISDESPLFAIIRDFTWDKFYVVGLPLEHSALNTICETIQKFIVPTKNNNTKNKRNKNTKKPIIQQIHPESKEHYVHKIKASFGEGLVEGTTSVDTDGDFMGELVVRLVWTSLLVNLHKSGYKQSWRRYFLTGCHFSHPLARLSRFALGRLAPADLTNSFLPLFSPLFS